MQCPVCANSLSRFEAGTFAVDICTDGCSGIWFDAGELSKCDGSDEPFPEELLRVRKNAAVVIDRNKSRSCPVCPDVKLQRVPVMPDRNFEIDACPVCHGNWLDIGELSVIRSESAEERARELRQQSFKERVERELQDPARRGRVMALVQLIFR